MGFLYILYFQQGNLFSISVSDTFHTAFLYASLHAHEYCMNMFYLSTENESVINRRIMEV